MDIDWQLFIFSPENHLIRDFEYLSSKRFQDTALADQAFNYALDQLQKNQWQKLQGFEGRSSAKTFVLVVFRHALEDFAIQQFGKWHTPVWIQKLGGLWSTIYKRLCKERQPAEAICNSLGATRQHQLEILQITRSIRKNEPQCGQVKHAQFETLSDEALTSYTDGQDPQSELDRLQQEKLYYALTQLFSSDPSDTTNLDITNITQAIAELQLTNEQMLLIKLCFQQNKSISEAARLLQRPDHTMRRLLKTTLEDLKRVLIAFVPVK